MIGEKRKRRASGKKNKKVENLTKKHRRRRKKTKKVSVARAQKKTTFFNVPIMGEIKLFSLVLLSVLLIFSTVFFLLFTVKSVWGYGMMPTLKDKDVLLIQKHVREVKRFDLLFLDNGRERDIRRVIGLPGEKISYEQDVLYVDNQPIDEKFIVQQINENQVKGQEFTEDFSLLSLTNLATIPEDYYLVLGDNRLHTTDSREYGLIEKSKIAGKVKVRLIPLETALIF